MFLKYFDIHINSFEMTPSASRGAVRMQSNEGSSNSTRSRLSHRRDVNRAAQRRFRQRQRDTIQDMQQRVDAAEAEVAHLLLQRHQEQQVCS